jgi:hypothetical protein
MTSSVEGLEHIRGSRDLSMMSIPQDTPESPRLETGGANFDSPSLKIGRQGTDKVLIVLVFEYCLH